MRALMALQAYIDHFAYAEMIAVRLMEEQFVTTSMSPTSQQPMWKP